MAKKKLNGCHLSFWFVTQCQKGGPCPIWACERKREGGKETVMQESWQSMEYLSASFLFKLVHKTKLSE